MLTDGVLAAGTPALIGGNKLRVNIFLNSFLWTQLSRDVSSNQIIFKSIYRFICKRFEIHIFWADLHDQTSVHWKAYFAVCA